MVMVFAGSRFNQHQKTGIIELSCESGQSGIYFDIYHGVLLQL
jgi:hypothetical protein